MKFVVSIYRDEDGVYIGECPSIPGCVSQGQTEAESNIADAIRVCS
jgi:predicted RNase H-like HicB family nuclease